MKYGEVVQDLAARGGNWKFYDENFRIFKAGTTCFIPMGYNSLGVMDAGSTFFKKASASGWSGTG